MARTDGELRADMREVANQVEAGHALSANALRYGKRALKRRRMLIGAGGAVAASLVVLAAVTLPSSTPVRQAGQGVPSHTTPVNPQSITSQSAWGDETVQSTKSSAQSSRVIDLRVEQLADYDRVTITFDGSLPSYVVRYVRQYTPPEGDDVKLRGGAVLQVQLAASIFSDQGRRLFHGQIGASYSYLAVKESRLSDYEGSVTIGLGVSRRTPFRVLETTGPLALVILVRH